MMILVTSLLALGIQGCFGDRYGTPLDNLALSKKQYEVQGKVYISNEIQFTVENFHYNGNAPAAYFYYGTEGEMPNSNGVRIADENGGLKPLGEYQGKTITLTLPSNVGWKRVKWISVWCDQFNIDFGHVLIPNNLVLPAPRVILPFTKLQHGVRSDTVTILDTTRIQIENLHYDGMGPTAFFWVGFGESPSKRGKIIPDENGKFSPLKPYTDGQTITLTLPSHMTFHDINWLSIWCTKFQINFGHVILPKDLNVPRYE